MILLCISRKKNTKLIYNQSKFSFPHVNIFVWYVKEYICLKNSRLNIGHVSANFCRWQKNFFKIIILWLFQYNWSLHCRYKHTIWYKYFFYYFVLFLFLFFLFFLLLVNGYYNKKIKMHGKNTNKCGLKKISYERKSNKWDIITIRWII